MSKLTFNQWLQQERPDYVRPGEKVLICLRGLPGAGKNFSARQLAKKYGASEPEKHIFSTDDFFTQKTRAERGTSQDQDQDFWDELEAEEYRSNWKPEALHHAHGWNFGRAEAAIKSGMTPVIIANTNVRPREIRPYLKLGIDNGYKVMIAEPESPWWLDHAHMLRDKKKHGEELENFARFLAGHHEGMSQKYGTRGNVHGVPLDTIRRMLHRWIPDLTPARVMNPSDPRED